MMVDILLLCVSLLGKGDTLNTRCTYYYDSLANMDVYTQADIKPVYSEKTSDMLTVFMKNISIKDSGELSFMVHLDFIIDTSGNVRFPRIPGKPAAAYNELEKQVIGIALYLKYRRPASCGNVPVPYLNRLRIIL